MPKNPDIKKVLVIGSGPIVIGQAAEFDYAGTQACRSLKEEGIEVVLLNSNPATIMTDKDIADRVYIEPLTVEVVEQLILKEKPDSVLPTLGGQAGLNLAMELEEAGFLRENNVRLIGTTSQTIKKAEDRLEFKQTMEKIGEPIAASRVPVLSLPSLFPSMTCTSAPAAVETSETLCFTIVALASSYPSAPLSSRSSELSSGSSRREAPDELPSLSGTGVIFFNFSRSFFAPCSSNS